MGNEDTMKVTADDIDHIAKLARLKLTVNEIEMLAVDMKKIIGYVDSINELDLEGTEPTSHVMPVANVYRDDIVLPSFDRDMILANAKSSKNGCFKVSNVVGKDEVF
jgi:aspartyl-tRNA(Asn)/glutamyl-tRNA(Gln) amidotransferase subunit C